ncbi:MAG: hypothetical protein C0478_14175 [Planctomyces sp.]|jgi:cytochrome bd-type quinol oxidase subunit 1|nr:hypothetical protein [Planctomyces sp.]
MNQFATLSYPRATMAWQYAAFLSLLSLLATTLAGASRGSSFVDTISSAFLATAILFPMGWWMGELGRQTAEDLAATDLANLDNMPTPEGSKPTGKT